MNRRPLQITIDSIVLDGVELSPEQQDALRSRLSAEIERRFSAPTFAPVSARREEIVIAEPLDLPENPAPGSLAVEIAGRIANALKT